MKFDKASCTNLIGIIMRLLQSFIQGIIVAILPLLVVGFSIAFTLPQASIHKDSLNQENFYQKLNDQLKKNYSEAPNSSQALGFIVIGPVVNKLVSPDWLKNISETNIDYITRWLHGDSNVLNFYLPTSEVEAAVRDGLNQQADKIVANKNMDISECNAEELKKLKSEGYDASKSFCLPAEVKSGQKKLGDVLNITGQNGFNSLDNVLKNNPISSLSNQVRAESVISNANQEGLSKLNWVRDRLIDFRGKILIFSAIFAILLAVDVVLVALSNKKILAHLRKLSWFLSTSILGLCIFWLLVTGGFSYLGSSLNLLLLPGFATSEIVNLLAWNLVRLSFNLILPALFIALGLFLANVIGLIIDKLGIFNNVKIKNKKLQKNSSLPHLASSSTNNVQNTPKNVDNINSNSGNISKQIGSEYIDSSLPINQPFDSQFKSMLKEKMAAPNVPSSLQSQKYDYDPEYNMQANLEINSVNNLQEIPNNNLENNPEINLENSSRNNLRNNSQSIPQNLPQENLIFPEIVETELNEDGVSPENYPRSSNSQSSVVKAPINSSSSTTPINEAKFNQPSNSDLENSSLNLNQNQAIENTNQNSTANWQQNIPSNTTNSYPNFSPNSGIQNLASDQPPTIETNSSNKKFLG